MTDDNYITLISRFWKKVKKEEHCWLWVGSRQLGGYGRFVTRGFRDLRRVDGAHRFSWALHYGPIPASMSVLHSCDAPSCVRPDHLFLGTQADNIRDAKAKGRMGLYRAGMPRKPLALRFWKKVDKSGECWLWTASKDRSGHGLIGLGGSGNVIRAHQASWLLHYGPVPSGYQVFHRCNTMSCVRPEHLMAGTPKDMVRVLIAQKRFRSSIYPY